jgi:uncharacterized protein
LAIYFLETSALVKLYVREQGTNHMLQLAKRLNGSRFAILSLAEVELRSAIRRRERAGDIDPKAATFVLDLFQFHIENRFLRQAVTDAVLAQATQLIDRYFLRAYDAVQLAAWSALKLSFPGERLTFVSSDQELLAAARAEQIPNVDPSAPFP